MADEELDIKRIDELDDVSLVNDSDELLAVQTVGTQKSTKLVTVQQLGEHIGTGGSDVSWTQVQESGTKIASISIDGTSTDVYAPNGGGGSSDVSWNQIQDTGTKIAEITIDGTSTDVYAPTGGGGGTSDYSDLSNKPKINNVELSGNKTSADLGIPNTVELTKAEYDNLSEAEKMNGTLYFITDGQSGGGGGASEAEYSTVEHKVGTWIDGSTLYERTFVCRENNTDLITFTGNIKTDGGTYDLGLTNVANVQLIGMNTTRADSGQTQYTDIAPLGTEVFVSFRNTDGALYFKATHGAVDLTVTLRYTKTSS